MAAHPRCLLLDFDGVVRHHHPDHEARASGAAGLEPGAMARIAFASDLMGPLVVGRISRAEWIELVAARSPAPDAVRRWLADWGIVDPAMRRLIGDARAAGLVVALLTNGTDTTPRELEYHGLSDAFDAVFNSSIIGRAKPDPAVFAHVCDILELAPADVVFFDDTLTNVVAAQGFGFRAHRFGSADTARSRLRAHGIPGIEPRDDR